MTLPADIARCMGIWTDTDSGKAVRSDCIDCARRIEGIGDYVQGRAVQWIVGPVQETPCPYRRGPQ